MVKKRLIFTLLYADGKFIQSRNFRHQKVGDYTWLQSNYNFKQIALSIDELVILDISKKSRDFNAFCHHIKLIVEGCFIPIAAGGGIRNISQALGLLKSGADKVVINTALFQDAILVKDLIRTLGSQCVIASIDTKKKGDNFEVWTNNGTVKAEGSLDYILNHINSLGVGEIYLNSIDKDGTGQGYGFEMLTHLSPLLKNPIIIAGGAGNYHHLKEGLEHPKIDAVATANLLHFIGTGLIDARVKLIENRIPLAIWKSI